MQFVWLCAFTLSARRQQITREDRFGRNSFLPSDSPLNFFSLVFEGVVADCLQEVPEEGTTAIGATSAVVLQHRHALPFLLFPFGLG